MYTLDDIKKEDQEIASAITDEFERQNSHIELIASENWVSPAVMSAMGSILTNKYAEGYPGRRYYGGCECVDEVEELARERAKKLFGAEYVNVQPHSGAQANMAVQFAILKPGDTIMGMNLDHGGHLTHGSPVNFSGSYFHVVPYGVNDEGFIDYDKVEEIALECKPKMIIAGASAYARTIDFKRFREIADKVDRSAAYATRWVAKNIVAAGLAKQCEVQVAYAIGVAKPVSIMVDTFGTGTVSDEKIEQAVEKVFDLTPAAIIRDLDLRKPIYRQLAAYGHMGREDLGVKWENTDRVDALKAAVAAL